MNTGVFRTGVFRKMFTGSTPPQLIAVLLLKPINVEKCEQIHWKALFPGYCPCIWMFCCIHIHLNFYAICKYLYCRFQICLHRPSFIIRQSKIMLNDISLRTSLEVDLMGL